MGMVTILLKLKLIEMNNNLIEEAAVHIYYKFSRIIANTAIIKQCCYTHLDLLIAAAKSIDEIENYNQVKNKIKAL
jgi:hypothetical protein